jgi:hypothetical protein
MNELFMQFIDTQIIINAVSLTTDIILAVLLFMLYKRIPLAKDMNLL